MITLHTYRGGDGLESFSPFCMKAEVYLKLAKLDYRTVIANPRKAPKGKAPWIEDDGTIVCDSSAIISYLEKKHGSPIDKGLSEVDRARGHMVQRMFEESLYFVMLWSRWAEDEGWEKISRLFFDGIPAPIRAVVAPLVRRQVIKQAYMQGTGRHTRDEIYALGEKDVRAFSTLLGERPYILDDQPRTADITAYSFIANVIRVSVDNPVKDVAKNLKNVGDYVDRIERLVKSSPGRKDG